jgi:phosphoglycolate phosphatase-like HAD superfamily hydrolase
MNCYIFDLDGTICNTEHRIHYITNGHKNWDAWHANAHKDEPINEVLDILRMAAANDIKIVLCTARDEKCRAETLEWLSVHDVPFNALYMRKLGDRRDDDIVKFELLEQIYEAGYNPIVVFEDRNRVVSMWRSAGLRCLQVAPGDF